MTDMNFPVIKYDSNFSPRQWGEQHGESQRQGIRELVSIRRNLLQEKNRRLTLQWIERLADEQWQVSRGYDQDLCEEIEGIAAGANLSLADLVVLNNYTDFRDLPVPDQGCSVVYINRGGQRVAGQTWDMHGSAKNYVCVIEIAESEQAPAQKLFSVVGCVGMMGFNSNRVMIGVNNINTDGAAPGVLWPMLIRRLLRQSSLPQLQQNLIAAPVTSGHTYLLACDDGAELWEVIPGLAECVGQLPHDSNGHLYHTNHCLGTLARQREMTNSLSSTTHKRYELIEQKIGRVAGVHALYDLLNDHENYPMSICSHYQTNTTDPSFTCGGAAGDLDSGQLFFWRGDALLDSNFRLHRFQI